MLVVCDKNCFLRSATEFYINDQLYHLEESGVEESEWTLGKLTDACTHLVDGVRSHGCDPGSTVCTPSPSTLNYTCPCSGPYYTRQTQTTCSPSSTFTLLASIQAAVLLLLVLLLLLVYINRKSKLVGMTSIHYMVIVGVIVTNVGVVVRFADYRYGCVIWAWAKEIGFVGLNGPILLKLYRSFAEFRSRKAHRWILREKDIIKYEVSMLGLVSLWLLSHTGVWLENGRICRFEQWGAWELAGDVGQLLFLLAGLNLSWHLKNSAQSKYYERWWFGGGLAVQLIFKSAELTLRHLVDTRSVWLGFACVHLLSTLPLGIVLLPKLFFVLTDKPLAPRTETVTLKERIKILELSQGEDLDFSQININDMDPAEIKYELKRVYTQLEILRNKTMRRDNPHISKRRGGRKPTRRRFSLQKRGSREKKPHSSSPQPNQPKRSVRYLDEGLEDSICSLEGPSYS